MCSVPPGKINVLEIDDRLSQTNSQLVLLLLFAFLHRRGRVARRGWERGSKGRMKRDGSKEGMSETI